MGGWEGPMSAKEQMVSAHGPATLGITLGITLGC